MFARAIFSPVFIQYNKNLSSLCFLFLDIEDKQLPISFFYVYYLKRQLDSHDLKKSCYVSLIFHVRL